MREQSGVAMLVFITFLLSFIASLLVVSAVMICSRISQAEEYLPLNENCSMVEESNFLQLSRKSSTK